MAELVDVFNQEKEKHLQFDEDEVLQGLTEDELQQLNLDLEDIDPDNQLLPAGFRQKNQTDKEPTGQFDRDKLLQFLEDEASNLKDEEEYVTYTPGLKRGKVYQKRELIKEALPKAQLDPELEECLNNATESELSDIAAILGMHSMVSSDQFYASCKNGGSSGVVKCSVQANPVVEVPNQTDVDETLRRLKENDSTLTEINLNNIKKIAIRTLKDYCESFKVNTHVRSWSLSNTRSNDAIANSIADMLKINRTLKVLNVESNFMTAEGICAILRALEDNDCLEEFRFDNQRSQFGHKVEAEIADLLLKNTSLKKVGYHFSLQGPRVLVADRLTRNNDLKRRKTQTDYNPSSVVTKTYHK